MRPRARWAGETRRAYLRRIVRRKRLAFQAYVAGVKVRPAKIDVRTRQRDQARLILDEVLGALAVFGEDATDADPAKVAKAQEHLDQVLVRAVHWRETSQAGGMMGTGHVAALGRAYGRLLFTGMESKP